MRYRLVIVAVTLLALSAAAHAQVPHIIGTWKLNIEASQFLGRAPQSEVRRYDVADNGYLVGLAVFIDAQGNPGFLQFAAKSDGQDYAEYSSGVLAERFALVDWNDNLAGHGELTAATRAFPSGLVVG